MRSAILLLSALACFVIGACYVLPAMLALANEATGAPVAPLWAVLAVLGAGLGWWLAAILLITFDTFWPEKRGG